MPILRDKLVSFVGELGLVCNPTTTDLDLERMIVKAGKDADQNSLSDELKDFLSSSKATEEVEDCLGKYYEATSPECRICLEAANCEFLTKGLSTPAFLLGSKTNVPKQFQKTKTKAAPPVPQSKGVSPKNQEFMDWITQNYPDAELCKKAVYYTVKKGPSTVVTIESVESNKPQFEVMFNRLKDPATMGSAVRGFKKKYDGWYYIGTSLTELKEAFNIHWGKQ